MNLTRKEMFASNLALAKQHLLQVLSDPTAYDWIPEGAHVIVLPLGKPRVFAANMRFAQELARKGDGQPIILLPERKRVSARKRTRAQMVNLEAA